MEHRIRPGRLGGFLPSPGMTPIPTARRLPLAFLIPTVALALPSQDRSEEAVDARAGTAASNTLAIHWHLPGKFEAARERARRENRLLLIKGISFGIDEAGAKCATKGRW